MTNARVLVIGGIVFVVNNHMDSYAAASTSKAINNRILTICVNNNEIILVVCESELFTEISYFECVIRKEESPKC